MDANPKMVSFRVPYAEYLRLQQSCSASGARNISELARLPCKGSWNILTRPNLRSKIELLTTELDRIASNSA